MIILHTLALTGLLGGGQWWPALPPSPIAALNDFYRSTGGKRWKQNQGWATDASPCDWYGIVCDVSYDAPGGGTLQEPRARIVSISLRENNLKGRLPPSLAELTDLRSLDVSENHLKGEIPETILERWDRNDLEFMGRGNSFSNLVARVVVRYSATGVLCSPDEDLRFMLDVRDGGAARFESIRCTPGTERETHCLVREGTDSIAGRFSRALSVLGYRSFEKDYVDGPGWTTHATELTTTVWWADGSRHTVRTYARQGPLELWMAQQLMLSLLTEPYWERTFTQPTCKDAR